MTDIPTPFQSWVQLWQIGPSMNDRHYAHEQKREPPALYTGLDGQVGPGWLPILDRMAQRLVDAGWDRQVDQIKEKFGTLRVYLRTYDRPEWSRIVSEAERESAVTCELCGQPGTTRGGGGVWITTRCEACHAAAVAERTRL